MIEKVISTPGLHLVLPLAAMLLAACSDGGGGGNKTVVESGPALEDGSPLSGRVVDGYLRYARVWIDINRDDELDTGEPFVESGNFGRFSFTDDMLAGIESPLDYPLLAFVQSGVAVDEDQIAASAVTPEEEAPGLVKRSYVLKAPPGLQFLTPFSTLAAAWIENDRAAGAANPDYVEPGFREAGTAINALLGLNTNLLRDYTAETERRLQAYAKAATIALQTETEIVAADLGNSVEGERETIDLLTGESIRLTHEKLLADIPKWRPAAGRYAESVNTPGKLLGMPLRRMERHMRLVLGADEPQAISSIEWYGAPDASSRPRTDLISNELALTSISSGGAGACANASTCELLARAEFKYDVFGKILGESLFGAMELQFVPHPVLGLQPTTTFRPESSELLGPVTKPSVVVDLSGPRPAISAGFSLGSSTNSTDLLATLLKTGYVDFGSRTDDPSVVELRFGSEIGSSGGCEAYAVFNVSSLESNRNPKGSDVGCLNTVWRFSFDEDGRITDETISAISGRRYKVSRNYVAQSGENPAIRLQLKDISMQFVGTPVFTDPAVRNALLGSTATLEDPLSKLNEPLTLERDIEAAIMLEVPAGTRARFERFVEDPTLDASVVNTALARLAPQLDDPFGINPLALVFSDSADSDSDAEFCGVEPAGGQAVQPVTIASYTYTDGRLSRVCRPNLGCPVSGLTRVTASWCWHMSYEMNRLDSAVLERVPAGMIPQGPASANIVMLQRYHYAPLIERLARSAEVDCTVSGVDCTETEDQSVAPQ